MHCMYIQRLLVHVLLLFMLLSVVMMIVLFLSAAILLPVCNNTSTVQSCIRYNYHSCEVVQESSHRGVIHHIICVCL